MDEKVGMWERFGAEGSVEKLKGKLAVNWERAQGEEDVGWVGLVVWEWSEHSMGLCVT